jgi:ElaB/YqjD/DUF883 family membrane-anchored ribosome-binding protein
MNANRRQAQLALDEAQKALDRARHALADKALHPNLAADYVRDVQRWTSHAIGGLGAEAGALASK